MKHRNKSFYSSKKWRRIRHAKLTTNPLCEDCETLKLVVPAKHVDHVVSVNDGGEPYELSNLRSLCISCHSRKTVYCDGGLGRAKSQYEIRAKGCDTSGVPIDPNHHWNNSGGGVKS